MLKAVVRTASALPVLNPAKDRKGCVCSAVKENLRRDLIPDTHRVKIAEIGMFVRLAGKRHSKQQNPK